MNEMLRSLGFGQVTSTKWTNGSTMMILVNGDYLNCIGDSGSNFRLTCIIDDANHDSVKLRIEKFMRMVGKCIQVDEK